MPNDIDLLLWIGVGGFFLLLNSRMKPFSKLHMALVTVAALVYWGVLYRIELNTPTQLGGMLLMLFLMAIVLSLVHMAENPKRTPTRKTH